MLQFLKHDLLSRALLRHVAHLPNEQRTAVIFMVLRAHREAVPSRRETITGFATLPHIANHAEFFRDRFAGANPLVHPVDDFRRFIGMGENPFDGRHFTGLRRACHFAISMFGVDDTTIPIDLHSTMGQTVL